MYLRTYVWGHGNHSVPINDLHLCTYLQICSYMMWSTYIVICYSSRVIYQHGKACQVFSDAGYSGGVGVFHVHENITVRPSARCIAACDTSDDNMRLYIHTLEQQLYA